ncbi:hypothetical protein BD310DRAFT_921282 [Dichomitus squalens]|uniref:Uncharacterized protein n=1 Tax=Dichomitus squalens TaxID=114155 RepID=A0A4Q9Q416_9APHY|nr:hypothetical protein BD310DRAFT_921282 [Dichomitus squalens]
MEAAGIQRTPIVNRTIAGGPIGMSGNSGSTWRQPQPANAHAHRGRQVAQRQPFSAMDGSYRTSVSTTRSDRSDSTAEVENLLAQTSRHTHGRNTNLDPTNMQWSTNMSRVPTAQAAPARTSTAQSTARAFGQPSKRVGPKFKPAGVPMG